eukprot:snap_masked-scaffold_9-processed-gene-13.87-mRNA-1 protein AED:1.00 eAED:1.00 QI:0/0/0/0/1/1/2/0/132
MVLRRTQRWIISIQEFQMMIKHIPGSSNILTDLLTRRGYTSTKETQRYKRENIVDMQVWRGMKFLASKNDVYVLKRKVMRMARMNSGSKTEVVKVLVIVKEELRRDEKMVKFIVERVGNIVSEKENKGENDK